MTGFIGNIAQTNGTVTTPRADFFRVLAGASNTSLSQSHAQLTGALYNGYMRGEAFAPTCTGWTPTYLSKNVYSTNDVLLLANPGASIVRCFITGLTGAWSSSRVNGILHAEPYAKVYVDPNTGNYRLAVFPNDQELPLPSDRVGAYGSCIQL